MMKRSELIRCIEELEEVMSRTAKRADIWQDRAVYTMARSLHMLMTDKLKEEKRE